jgi:hypothetical protein
MIIPNVPLHGALSRIQNYLAISLLFQSRLLRFVICRFDKSNIIVSVVSKTESGIWENLNALMRGFEHGRPEN